MSMTHVLVWAAMSTALAAPAVCGAQATDPGSGAMAPYASRQSSAPPSDYGQPAYDQSPYGSPRYDQPDAGRYADPSAGYGPRDSGRDDSPAVGSRNTDERYDSHDASDRGYGADTRDDDGADRRPYAGENNAGGGSRFRELEQHIRDGLADGVRGDYLDPDDARDLLDQLRRVQQQESREYRAHGPNLPAGDEARIFDELRQLDKRVDMIRERS